jgi:hypothetical protein
MADEKEPGSPEDEEHKLDNMPNVEPTLYRTNTYRQTIYPLSQPGSNNINNRSGVGVHIVNPLGGRRRKSHRKSRKSHRKSKNKRTLRK